MKVNVAIRVPAEMRRHTPVNIISGEFNKGIPYKSAGRTQSPPLEGGEGREKSPDTKSGSRPGQRDRVPAFHQQKRAGVGGGGGGMTWLKVPGNKHPVVLSSCW